MRSSLAITASAGNASATIEARRPSWADMKKHYPDKNVPTPELYDQKIGGNFKKIYLSKAYANTCAVRMSYALNRSGLKLGIAPSNNGNRVGGDGFNYWLRVQDVKGELMKRFKGTDEELVLKLAPKSVIGDQEALDAAYGERWEAAQDFIDNKLAGRNGIVVFETRGYLNATGHFTLWDGDAKRIAYAPGHDDPDSAYYYFWLTTVVKPEDAPLTVLQTAKVKFWELK
jgi:hypothetical protein